MSPGPGPGQPPSPTITRRFPGLYHLYCVDCLRPARLAESVILQDGPRVFLVCWGCKRAKYPKWQDLAAGVAPFLVQLRQLREQGFYLLPGVGWG